MKVIHHIQRVEASESIKSFVVWAEEAKWHGVDVFRIGTVTVIPKRRDPETLADIRTKVLPTIGSLIYHEIKHTISNVIREAVEATNDEALYDRAWQLNAELIDASVPYIWFSGDDAVILACRFDAKHRAHIASWLAPNEVYTFPDNERRMWRPKKESDGPRDFYAFTPSVRRRGGNYRATFYYENVKAIHRRSFYIECERGECGYMFLRARCENEDDVAAVIELIADCIDTKLDEGLFKDYRLPDVAAKITRTLKEPHDDWILMSDGRDIEIDGDDASFAKISIETLESLHKRAGVG